MKAQQLYNLREETGFCSGEDLHRFFFEQMGDASPSGYVEISAEEARHFVGRQTAHMVRLNLGDDEVIEIAP
jgi:hypothetical protein